MKELQRRLPEPLCQACGDSGWAEDTSAAKQLTWLRRNAHSGKREEVAAPQRSIGPMHRCACQRLRRLELLGRRPWPALPAAATIDQDDVSHAEAGADEGADRVADRAHHRAASDAESAVRDRRRRVGRLLRRTAVMTTDRQLPAGDHRKLLTQRDDRDRVARHPKWLLPRGLGTVLFQIGSPVFLSVPTSMDSELCRYVVCNGPSSERASRDDDCAGRLTWSEATDSSAAASANHNNSRRNWSQPTGGGRGGMVLYADDTLPA